MCSWYNNKGPDSDVIVSSRVRLARNFKNFSFPNRINSNDAQKIVDEVKNCILNGSSYLSKEFNYMDVFNLDEVEKTALLEKHLISSDLIMNQNQVSGILLSKDENVSIMINEEDHIRIQSILPGMQLSEAWELSDKIDNLLEERVDYAFNEDLGYLTTCPTNVGTGLRASVMVHLPALNMIGHINGLFSTISKFGVVVRGLYGEGSEALGNMFQISNQITLGQSEEDVLSSINGVINQIIEKERMARNKIIKENNIQLEDKVFRSYGIFTNARLLSSNECMNLLSDIKLGIDLGILNNISVPDINELMVITQPASIQKTTGRSLEESERDIKRADIVRKKLMKKES